jgi:uncharacterized protein YbjT (DUF2867 family)
MTKIAVTGATGRLGQPLVEILEAQGHEVVSISRSKGVDVISGEGLAEALDGVDVIVDAATGPSPDQQEATDFFTTSARNLHEAGEAAGVKRAVLVSIIGIDKFSTGYNAAKQAQEKAWLSGSIPTRIVRAAQFHEFVPQLLDWGRQGDVAYLPTMNTQVVAARTVAEVLAQLATLPDSAPATGPTLEVAGPRAERLAELARTVVEHRGESLRVEETTEFFDESDLYDSDAPLPGPGAKLAGPTFEEWLKAS